MNKFLFPLTAVALCFTAHQAMAATATSTSANAKAKIISPLKITALTGAGNDLNFGTMLAGTNTVTVSTAGGRTDTSTPAGSLLVNDSNTPSAGKFKISNETGDSVAGTLVLPTSVEISNGNGGTMTVSNFVSSPAAGSQTIATGDTNVSVGADLAVGATQASGDYTGTYTITVNY